MTIEQLHALYCELTGYHVRLDMSRERDWFEWQKLGFHEDDLRLVVRAIQRRIKDGIRQPAALKFSNLIGQPDLFEEDLAMYRALHRPGPPKTQTVRYGNTERVIPGNGLGEAPRVVADVLRTVGSNTDKPMA